MAYRCAVCGREDTSLLEAYIKRQRTDPHMPNVLGNCEKRLNYRFRRLPVTAEKRSRRLGYMRVYIEGEARTTSPAKG